MTTLRISIATLGAVVLGISSRGQLHRVLPSEPDTFSPRQRRRRRDA
jgi:hypothetical protein